MHRRLKENIAPPQRSLAAQQRDLERFQRHYNEERPHEALGGIPPASRYRPSTRAYPSRVQAPEYDSDIQVRRVRSNGQIKWHGKMLFVSEALIGEHVGLRQIDEDRWQLLFCKMRLGLVNERISTIERLG